MRVIVTGAAGLIGQSISRVLVENGYKVLGLDCAPNTIETLESLHVRPLHVNLGDIDESLHVIEAF